VRSVSILIDVNESRTEYADVCLCQRSDTALRSSIPLTRTTTCTHTHKHIRTRTRAHTHMYIYGVMNREIRV
jgi:hypothetical protein